MIYSLEEYVDGAVCILKNRDSIAFMGNLFQSVQNSIYQDFPSPVPREAIPQVLNRGVNPPQTGASTAESVAASAQPGHTGAAQENSWAAAPELAPSLYWCMGLLSLPHPSFVLALAKLSAFPQMPSSLPTVSLTSLLPCLLPPNHCHRQKC